MMLGFVVAISAHVPTYGDSNCVKFPHNHKISQVVYRKGSGGAEVHLESDTVPFNTLAGEEIDVDVVFRDEVDPSRFSLYLGCGGCADGDPIASEPLNLTYEHGKVEVFTQQITRSVFPGIDWPKFNTSALTLANCPARHFGIRLVDHHPGAQPEIVWGAVIGRAEEFSPVELLSFPLYILKNHGSQWNDIEWSAWLFAFLAPLLLRALLFLLAKCIPSKKSFDDRLISAIFAINVTRLGNNWNFFFALAIWGYTWSALECITHFFWAQSKGPVEGVAFGLFWGLVVLWGHAGLIYIPVTWWGAWSASLFIPTGRAQPSCWYSKYWGFLDIFFGLLWLFYGLGGGFWVGPSALALAGLCRLFQSDEGYVPFRTEPVKTAGQLPAVFV